MSRKYSAFLRRIACYSILGMILLFSSRANAQSITGNTCVTPGFFGPYNINGVTWSTADKWCVSGGTLGSGTSGCLANPGSPTIGVTWGTGVSTGTLSYYHPATATTPTATLTVTIFNPGGIAGGDPNIPLNTVVSQSYFSTNAATGCAGTIGYSWQIEIGTGAWNTVAGQTGASATFSVGPYTQNAQVRRLAFYTATPGTTFSSNTYPILVPTEGAVSPASQSVASGAIPTPLSAPLASNCDGSFSYQWFSSPTPVQASFVALGSSFSNPGSSVPLTLPAATTSTYYELQATCPHNGSVVISTNMAFVNVLGGVTGGTLTPLTQTINPGTMTFPITSSAPSGGSGSFTYQWQSSTTGPTGFTNIAVTPTNGANTLTLSPGVVSATTQYQLVSSSSGGNGISPAPAQVIVSGTPVYGVWPANNPTGTADANLNWILTRTFDGGGNSIGEVKNFFDNTGSLLQSQNKVYYRKDNTTTFPLVLATQNLADAYGRYVATTLPASIDYSDFSFQPSFVRAADGSNYTYKNFDLYNPTGSSATDKTNAPDLIGGQAARGTLGWYYSSNNLLEPYTATSSLPYSRLTVYRDGSNKLKKVGGVAEPLAMGTGHENSTFTVQVFNELQNYLNARNQFFPTAQIGNPSTNLFNNAIMSVGRDPNGLEAINITDRMGNVIMTGRAGSGLSVTNTVNLMGNVSVYDQQLTITATSLTLSSVTASDGITLPSTILVSIFQVGTNGALTQIFVGTAASIPVGLLGSGSYIFLADAPVIVNYTDAASPSTTLSGYSEAEPSAGTLVRSCYFNIFQDGTAVALTGNYSIYNMNAELVSLGTVTTLNTGYYKIVANSGLVTLNYTNSFTDVAYYFYNEVGQMIANVSPKGTPSLFNTGYLNFTNIASVPYASTISYGNNGSPVSKSTPDRGTLQTLYRQDGKLRFSQNAVQAQNGSYSYTDYDAFGRIVESGQFQPGTGAPAFSTASGSALYPLLENVSTPGVGDALSVGNKTDVIVNVYDAADNGYVVTGNGISSSQYVQDPQYVGGAVSTTKLFNTVTNNSFSTGTLVSQTWYNYDEEGKVVWSIKYIAALGLSGYKTTDFTYDNLSRLTKKVFQMGNSAETFAHYFVYDPVNGNLWRVYTSPSNLSGDPSTNGATLQAHYVYYLHGGLERLELGSNTQGIDYTYTLQGYLKAINNANATADPAQDGIATGNTFVKDAYGEVLDYFPNDYVNSRTGVQPIFGVTTSGVTESYAGNAKAMSWFSTKPPATGSASPNAYIYHYDNKYELTQGTYGTIALPWPVGSAATPTTGSAYMEGAAYDANGNIINMTRFNGSSAPSSLSNYTISSTSNQVNSIFNSANGITTTYTYDPSGREISEVSTAGSKYLQYNVLGQVTLVASNSTFTNYIVQFVYDEAGNRIIKYDYAGGGTTATSTTYYYGDVVYTQAPAGLATPLEYQVEGANGRLGIYNKPSQTYVYQLTDHLGSVRAVVAQTTGVVQAAQDYYPYGLTLIFYNSTGRYGYQMLNSESDAETGWNGFKHRMYNSTLGRWLQSDVQSDKAGTYNGMDNNPVSNTDPDGTTPVNNTGTRFEGQAVLNFFPLNVSRDQTDFNPYVTQASLIAFALKDKSATLSTLATRAQGASGNNDNTTGLEGLGQDNHYNSVTFNRMILPIGDLNNIISGNNTRTGQ